jgi:hypothetical protein
MSEKPISPLRQRMIEDMSVRNFGEKTRNDYIRHVKTFTAFAHSIVRARKLELIGNSHERGSRLARSPATFLNS